MRIDITTCGFYISDDDGNWLLSQHADERRFRKLDADKRMIESDDCMYIRSDDGLRTTKLFSGGGMVCVVRDAWGNQIAYCKTSRIYGNTMTTYEHKYTKRRDGSVHAKQIAAKSFSDYWQWHASVQRTFEVKEYVAPADRVYKCTSEGSPLLDSYWINPHMTDEFVIHDHRVRPVSVDSPPLYDLFTRTSTIWRNTNQPTNSYL